MFHNKKQNKNNAIIFPIASTIFISEEYDYSFIIFLKTSIIFLYRLLKRLILNFSFEGLNLIFFISSMIKNYE